MGDIGGIVGIIAGLISIFTFVTGVSSLTVFRAKFKSKKQKPAVRRFVNNNSRVSLWLTLVVFVASLTVTILIFSQPKIVGVIRSVNGSEDVYIGGIQTKLEYVFPDSTLIIKCVYQNNASRQVEHPGGDITNTYECKNGDQTENLRLWYFSVEPIGKLAEDYSVRYKCAGIDIDAPQQLKTFSAENGGKCGRNSIWLNSASGTIETSWAKCLYRTVFGAGCFL